MNNLDRYFIFGNMTWSRDESYMELGKRHASSDGKTSLCGRFAVSDTAWIAPLFNAELVSCRLCADKIAQIVNAQPQLALAVGS